MMCAAAKCRAELETNQACLLGQLTDDRSLVRLPRLNASSRRSPDGDIGEIEADEQDPVGRINHERPRALPQPHGSAFRKA